MSEEKKESKGGAGLDIGTANLLCARTVGNKTQIQMQRNAFIEVDNDEWQQKALTSLKVQYAKYEGRMFVMGDSAFELANVLKKSTRRPMRNGMISPDDIDALPIIKLMIKKLLGNPRSSNEPVVYSVPANPIDSPMNVAYHKKIFEGVLLSLGYDPKPIMEGHAVIMSELIEDDFTGIGISCGGGMFNVCVSYRSIPAVTFSTARGGDWIDHEAAMVTGNEQTRMTRIKERGVNLIEPKTREEQALAIYTRELIEGTLKTIANKLVSEKQVPEFESPISIVLAGGTALAGGFRDVFEDVFKSVRLPIEVKQIRLAEEPLQSVAKGCLIHALNR